MTPNSKLKQTHELGTLLGLWNHPVRRPEVKTLVGYKDWMDSIAQLIGCEAVLVEETLGVASLKSFSGWIQPSKIPIFSILLQKRTYPRFHLRKNWNKDWPIFGQVQLWRYVRPPGGLKKTPGNSCQDDPKMSDWKMTPIETRGTSSRSGWDSNLHLDLDSNSKATDEFS